jgi:orotidine-5'-phosphate decarboxylase
VTGYLDRLAERTASVGSCLCLGIDPDPSALPEDFSADVRGIEAFANVLLDVAGPHAAAVKANLSFFEAFGSAGMAALERLRVRIPPDLPFIADAKRGDIGSTAGRQSVALFDALGADAITANPYLGREALDPFLERSDRFVYVLCRTSNAGAAETQNLATDTGDPLYLRIARIATGWATTSSTIGLVVGATAPSELAQVREAAPGLPFLVPGVGAQGGDVGAALADGPTRSKAGEASRRGGSLLVNVSRGIASAAVSKPTGRSVEDAVAEAAAEWSAKLRC